jgi:O-antigen/teichoic acid export membrane protein
VHNTERFKNSSALAALVFLLLAPTLIMVKKFLNTLAIIFALNILIKPVWIFGIDLTVQNRLGPEIYGTYYALLSLSMLFNILLDLGLTHFNNRKIARDPEEIKARYGRIAALKGLLGISYVAFLLPISKILGYGNDTIPLLLLLAAYQFLLSYMLFLRSNISGLQLFKTDALLSVIDKTMMILICGWLLFFPPENYQFQILDFVWTQAAGLMIAVGIASFIIARNGGSFRVALRADIFREALIESWPYALLILLMAFHNRLDGLMLERLSGPESAGIYAAAYRLVEALNQFSFLTAVLLLPMFSKMLAKRESVAALTQTAWTLLLVAGVGVAALGAYYGPGLMQQMYLQKAEETGRVFIPLAFGFTGYAMTFVFGSLLTAQGNLRALNNIAGFALLFNGVLNFILIPTFGAWGAAVTTLITQATAAMLQFYVCNRRFNFQWGGLFYLKGMFFMTMSFISTWLIFSWLGYGLASFLFAGFLIPLWALISGWVDIKGLKKVWKQPI